MGSEDPVHLKKIKGILVQEGSSGIPFDHGQFEINGSKLGKMKKSIPDTSLP